MKTRSADNDRRAKKHAGLRSPVGCVLALVLAGAWAARSHALDIAIAPADGESSGDALAGANLKTDTEVNDLLARADQFSKQGRYDLASTLWQKVIDSSNDLVFTRDDWIEKTLEHEYQRYRSVTGDIEGTLAELPKEGLEGYRLKADGEAKRALARPGADEREAALAEVVRRFFLSAHGDDAAFELACRKLDRYEFLPAIRLLDKVINDYPNPSVDKDEVLLRLAALNARVGDASRALEIIADLRERVTPSVPDAVIDLVEEDIKKAGGTVSADGGGIGVWPMIMGGPGRQGLMPKPQAAPVADAGEGWAQPTELRLPDDWDFTLPDDEKDVEVKINVDDPFAPPQARSGDSGNDKAATPESMLEDWPKHGWLPASRALFDSGRMYFKNHNRVVCLDPTNGELKWLGFRNEYPFPPVYDNSRRYSGSSRNNSVGRDPGDSAEVQNFADSVHQSMCIVRDKVLTLQGKPVDFTEENVPTSPAPMVGGRVIVRGGGEEMAARYRANRLVAYHARNGKLQWMRSAGEPDADVPKRACFAGPPVPYAGLVLVPVLEDRGMYLVAIEPEGGATLWRTFLGDESSATAAHSAIVVAVDGGEAYVATGAGLVFSVDAISGSMNWAVRYQRTARTDSQSQQQIRRFGGFMPRGYQFLAKFDGWAEEMVIPSANAVVVTPVDFNYVMAFDRRSGELLWESPRKPSEGGFAADYALGVHDGKFYAAGNDVVRCYRVSGGRMLWEKTFEAGFGRGALTPDGIYIPSGKDEVLKIGLDDGEVAGTFKVAIEGDQPVGNLYTDGNQLFGLGLRRVYSIAQLDPEEAQ